MTPKEGAVPTKTKAPEAEPTESIVLDADGVTHVKIDRAYTREDIMGLAKRVTRASLEAN